MRRELLFGQEATPKPSVLPDDVRRHVEGHLAIAHSPAVAAALEPQT
jgi:hypothetical protein